MGVTGPVRFRLLPDRAISQPASASGMRVGGRATSVGIRTAICFCLSIDFGFALLMVGPETLF